MNRGITKDQVIEACEKLITCGIEPSIKIIRRELGDTGSEATIHKHLQTWRRERVGELTEELLKKESEAKQKQDELMAVRDKEFIQMQADNAELEASLDEKMQEIEAQNLEIKELKKMVDNLEEKNRQQAGEIEALKIAMTYTEKHTETLNTILESIAKASELDKATPKTPEKRIPAPIVNTVTEVTEEPDSETTPEPEESKPVKACAEPVVPEKETSKDETGAVAPARTRGNSLKYLRQLYSGGLNYKEIANRLNEGSYPTMSGRRKWSQGMVKKIIDRETTKASTTLEDAPAVTENKTTGEVFPAPDFNRVNPLGS